MNVGQLESPSRLSGQGFEALGLCVMILLITSRAWWELWFGPAFEESMRHLFSGTAPAPPKLADQFATYWQWLLAAAAITAVITTLIRSRWMRLASIIWCGSILGHATVAVVQGRSLALSLLIVLAAVATAIGVGVFRARAA